MLFFGRQSLLQDLGPKDIRFLDNLCLDEGAAEVHEDDFLRHRTFPKVLRFNTYLRKGLIVLNTWRQDKGQHHLVDHLVLDLERIVLVEEELSMICEFAACDL